MFTYNQYSWLNQVVPAYKAAHDEDTLVAFLPCLITSWFQHFPIEDEDDDDFFDGQPQLVDAMKRLFVEVSLTISFLDPALNLFQKIHGYLADPADRIT